MFYTMIVTGRLGAAYGAWAYAFDTAAAEAEESATRFRAMGLTVTITEPASQ